MHGTCRTATQAGSAPRGAPSPGSCRQAGQPWAAAAAMHGVYIALAALLQAGAMSWGALQLARSRPPAARLIRRSSMCAQQRRGVELRHCAQYASLDSMPGKCLATSLPFSL